MKPGHDRRVLSDLFGVQTPDDLLAEVLAGVKLPARSREGELVAGVLAAALRLYRGEWELYRACDTPYHDTWHAAETFLAMGCLISGAVCEGAEFTARERALGLMAAILHDAGYIRRHDEQGFPGARLRAIHERRGVEFLKRHKRLLGLTDEEVRDSSAMIQSTQMSRDIATIDFHSESTGQLGRMLATADLLAQLSSATYLEKLMDLFEEDQGDELPRYADIMDCYRKALDFDTLAQERLAHILPAYDAFLASHFRSRWGESRNLYAVAIERQNHRLTVLMRRKKFEPRRDLRRWGSLRTIRRVFQ